MTFKYILHVFTRYRHTSQFQLSDYYYLVYYHDYASLPTFLLKNIFGFNDTFINKSTLSLIACQIILAVNENFKANFYWR